MFSGNLETKGPSLIAISPDAFSIAVISNNQLRFYDALTFKCDEIIDNACSGKLT
jgi:hypothetical protein